GRRASRPPRAGRRAAGGRRLRSVDHPAGGGRQPPARPAQEPGPGAAGGVGRRPDGASGAGPWPHRTLQPDRGCRLRRHPGHGGRHGGRPVDEPHPDGDRPPVPCAWGLAERGGQYGGCRERREPPTEVQAVIAPARGTMTVKRVFGEPYEKDGVTIIPAARVQGGAGGGSGEDPQGQGRGSGSGFGVTARPVGAFIIQGGELSWRPAVDVNRIILGGQAVVIIALLTLPAVVQASAKR